MPLHFTAFHPDFKMRDIPPTPPSTLTRARADRARGRAASTSTPATCTIARAAPPGARRARRAVIERDWYAIDPVGLAIGDGGVGSCRACGARIVGQYHLPVRASEGRRRGLGLVYD